MQQTQLRLSTADRAAATAVRAKGVCSAREVNRAHILLALDQRIPESQIMAVLGVGRMMVWRTRAAYLDGGLDLALRDVQRSGAHPSTTPRPKYGPWPWPAQMRLRAARAGPWSGCTRPSARSRD